jgi:hypothetical protein
MLVAVLVIAVVAGSGIHLKSNSHAASPYGSVEAEKGTLADGATLETSSSASNGSYVLFDKSSSAPELKPPLVGLLDRGALSPANNPTSYSLPAEPYLDSLQGVVANVRWSDLQPDNEGQAIQPNQLDTVLADVKSYNATHSNQLSVKLRIFAGVDAPNWALHMDDWNPVAITNLQSPSDGGNLGPFWTPDYDNAYKELMDELATKYDSNPLLKEVTISQCMTVFAEPFMRDDSNLGELLYDSSQTAYYADHGTPYSETADKNCLTDEVDNSTAWKQTHLSLSFNAYRPWIPSGNTYIQGPTDEPFTASVMDHCRDVLITQCTIENNSIRASFVGDQNQAGGLYSDIYQRKADITFQTAGASEIGDIDTTVNWAASIGANAVELPSNYTTLSISDLNSLANELKANPTK